MDLLRLQKALLLARMNADSTYLVDEHAPGFSSKLDRLEELFEELAAEEARKIVLFSEWTTMLTLIERRIKRFNLDFVRLDGSVRRRSGSNWCSSFSVISRPAACSSRPTQAPRGSISKRRIRSSTWICHGIRPCWNSASRALTGWDERIQCRSTCL